jgi:hypothetical protein
VIDLGVGAAVAAALGWAGFRITDRMHLMTMMPVDDDILFTPLLHTPIH